MISYAAVDRIEEDTYVVCEVELNELQKSHLINNIDKKIKMMDVLMVDILDNIESVKENDVLVVEHNGENIIQVLYKDDEEKQRRLGDD